MTTTTELSAQAKKTCKGMQIKDKSTAGYQHSAKRKEYTIVQSR